MRKSPCSCRPARRTHWRCSKCPVEMEINMYSFALTACTLKAQISYPSILAFCPSTVVLHASFGNRTTWKRLSTANIQSYRRSCSSPSENLRRPHLWQILSHRDHLRTLSHSRARLRSSRMVLTAFLQVDCFLRMTLYREEWLKTPSC